MVHNEPLLDQLITSISHRGHWQFSPMKEQDISVEPCQTTPGVLSLTGFPTLSDTPSSNQHYRENQVISSQNLLLLFILLLLNSGGILSPFGDSLVSFVFPVSFCLIAPLFEFALFLIQLPLFSLLLQSSFPF